MTRIAIKAVYESLEEAIRNSKQAYGLKVYDKGELKRKQDSVHNLKFFMLSEEGEIWYVTRLKSRGGSYRILRKFSWHSMLHNGAAALCSIVNKDCIVMATFTEKWKRKPIAGDQILIGEYEYNRDDLRKGLRFWTIDS